MSLFRARDCWSTLCGQNETFSCDALTVDNLFEDTDKKHEDNIIVGSLNGVLRVYSSKILCRFNQDNISSFLPSDLLIEVQTDSPILQVCTGKLVSCSPNKYIAALRPFSVLIYSINRLPGSTDHGDQYILETAYEHQFQCSAYQMVIGPFGGGTGKRDFICILSLDGTLMVYEQQTFGFRTILPLYLHPYPLKYVESIDAFVTLNSDLCLSCYKYQELADSNIKQKWPMWSCNMGETVYDIQTVSMTSSLTTIHVLGERNYYCFQGNGVLWFMKRLQYSPICFHPYIIDSHPDTKMICMIVSDVDTLMIYEQTKLKWTAKLPYRPSLISRASFKEIQGCLVLLSEVGELRLCYLGTQPETFMAPERPVIEYKDAANELAQLKENVEKMTIEDDTNTPAWLKLSLRCKDIYPSTETRNTCDVEVDLVPSLTTSCTQVSFLLTQPLKAIPSVLHFNNLSESVTIHTKIFRDNDDMISAVSSLYLLVFVYYFTEDSQVPGLVQQSIRLPLSMMYNVRPQTPVSDFMWSIKFSVDENPIALKLLFKEFFGGSNSEQDLFLCTTDSNSIQIINSASTNIYEIRSTSPVIAYPIIQEILLRHKEYYKSKKCIIRCDKSEIPTEILFKFIEEHIDLLAKLSSIQDDIASLCAQYRIIQKCLFNKLKENTVESVSSMSILIDDTHTTLMEKMTEADVVQRDVKVKRSHVDSLARLLIVILELCSENDTELKYFKETLFCSNEYLEWEKIVYQSLSSLVDSEILKLNCVQNDNPEYLKTNLRMLIDHFVRRIITPDEEFKQSLTKDNSRGSVSPILESDEDFYS
ncbi:protein PTHB1 isoform X1 [Daktulosphaira vitifoliae]|uniref:protein PTHB1 isoform X1 n=1 Tax=Daktulosphaira vitifoliae TaxID=58002 RepID=UPI0021AAF671|nr:protein PTHB1 isoform X1 [Daktulosphaira vitifoliae]XP_050536701.1 protein PTHB1 isoform X1 [Daktulosphaira vitifoliae]XP_050536703.1 protein PTHB1 isoform X1 [Daktulosphaira vitifoliae]XP_050536704.1 protein PTHB1 isoform X1 [Daktulosphaira vitifoliae]